MDSETAYEILWERESTLQFEIYEEWSNAKGTDSVQTWNLIPSSLFITEWKYNSRTGNVHENKIQRMQDILIDNYIKIYINTVLMGHTSTHPLWYLEGIVPEDWDSEDMDEFLDGYEDYCIDDKNSWRISDYAIERMESAIHSLIREEDYCKKVYWIDTLLSIVHCRSDLASWFIQGGSKTLSLVSGSIPE